MFSTKINVALVVFFALLILATSISMVWQLTANYAVPGSFLLVILWCGMVVLIFGPQDGSID